MTRTTPNTKPSSSHDDDEETDEVEEYEYSDQEEDYYDEDMMDDEEPSEDCWKYNSIELEIEDAYRLAKSKQLNRKAALSDLENVIQMEQNYHKQLLAKDCTDSDKEPEWTFRALKQMVKVVSWHLLHHHDMNDNAVVLVALVDQLCQLFRRYLHFAMTSNIDCVKLEKGTNSVLEKVSLVVTELSRDGFEHNEQQTVVAPSIRMIQEQILNLTISKFINKTNENKSCERLWFKAQILICQSHFALEELDFVELRLAQLIEKFNITPPLAPSSPLRRGTDVEETTPNQIIHGQGSSSSPFNSYVLETYALQMQLYSRKKDIGKMKETFNQALKVECAGIYYPRTLAVILKLAGEMFLSEKDFNRASKTLFEGFKLFDFVADARKILCLKHSLLALMLDKSPINPFDGQEACNYKDLPEIVPMIDLLEFFLECDVDNFERTLSSYHSKFMKDSIMAPFWDDLYSAVREYALMTFLRQRDRASLQELSVFVPNFKVSEIESMVNSMIIEGRIEGKVDAVSKIYLKTEELIRNQLVSLCHEPLCAICLQGNASTTLSKCIACKIYFHCNDPKCKAMHKEGRACYSMREKLQREAELIGRINRTPPNRLNALHVRELVDTQCRISIDLREHAYVQNSKFVWNQVVKAQVDSLDTIRRLPARTRGESCRQQEIDLPYSLLLVDNYGGCVNFIKRTWSDETDDATVVAPNNNQPSVGVQQTMDIVNHPSNKTAFFEDISASVIANGVLPHRDRSMSRMEEYTIRLNHLLALFLVKGRFVSIFEHNKTVVNTFLGTHLGRTLPNVDGPLSEIKAFLLSEDYRVDKNELRKQKIQVQQLLDLIEKENKYILPMLLDPSQVLLDKLIESTGDGTDNTRKRIAVDTVSCVYRTLIRSFGCLRLIEDRFNEKAKLFDESKWKWQNHAGCFNTSLWARRLQFNRHHDHHDPGFDRLRFVRRQRAHAVRRMRFHEEQDELDDDFPLPFDLDEEEDEVLRFLDEDNMIDAPADRL